MLENHAANVRLMQKLNRLKVLNIVRGNGKIQRANIAGLSGLSLSSITNIVNYLMSLGFILDGTKETDCHVGRKATILEFNYDAYSLLCVSVTKREIVTAICNLKGEIKHESTAYINAGDNIEDLIFSHMTSLVNSCPNERIMAAGVAISAMVMDGGNTVFSSTFGCSIHDFADRLKQKLGLPVIIENLSIINAKFHSSENFENTKNLLFIDFLGGIGAVQIFCGKANRAFVGEIGHTTIDVQSNTECICGNRGCLEVLCSHEHLMKNAGVQSIAQFKENFLSGEDDAQYAVMQYTEYLGTAVANLIDILGPDNIIINGEEIFECEEIYSVFLNKVKQRAYSRLMEKTNFTLTYTDAKQRIRGMAQHLCDVAFDISFDDCIIE